MIKLIITDVDGVLTGNIQGVNFPYPSKKVIAALKDLNKKYIPIVLCTGKYRSSIDPIVERANLTSPYITDSGALIIDPVRNKAKAFFIDRPLVSRVISDSIKNDIYIEVFTKDGYFIESHVEEITPGRHSILQKHPVIAEAFHETASTEQVIKILAVAKDHADHQRIDKILADYKGKLTMIWSSNPSTRPHEYLLITSKDASKKHASRYVAEQLGISFDQTLGIGDTLGDWEFMRLCKYVGVMGDAPNEFKDLARSKGKGNFFIAPPSNEDGVLKIFDCFLP